MVKGKRCRKGKKNREEKSIEEKEEKMVAKEN